MGDVGEDLGTKFVFIVTFLGLFVLLVTTMPSGFYTEKPEYRTPDIPEYFEAIDIQYFGDTKNWTITSDPYDVDWELGGRKMYFRAHYGSNWITNTPFEWIVGVKVWGSKMHWVDNNGIDKGNYLTKEILEANYDEESQVSEFIVQGKTFEMKAFFAYNTTLWSNTTDAWANNDLRVLFGIDIDKTQSTMNAWNLLGMLLTFQLPNVHPVLNAIIALPIWACIVYLTYRLILLAIPFVG